MTVLPTSTRVWLSEDDCRLEDLLAIIGATTNMDDYPHARAVEQGVLVYDSAMLPRSSDRTRREIQAEWVRALTDGPGVIVCHGAFDDHDVVDRATDAFAAMIADQRTGGGTSGDHFARPGANDRVWNALEKLALHDPATFVDYYANDVLALVCAAWLGPGYQVTSQINVVNPGGQGQTVHRDYHLGFQSNDVAAQYPAHTHVLSPVLTLQGAVAHCDMPIESGPTLYLPHSQKYELGYLAWRRPEFREYFQTHHVQLPLAKGDAVFFNPALYHAAGSNHSQDIRRMANLLQVSSAFGRAMESVDRTRMCRALYPVLLERRIAGWVEPLLDNAVAAAAEGYSFPTNLGHDQPLGGLASQTQADLVRQALREGWDPSRFEAGLDAHAQRRLA
ncbi:phytanoyl-CoA dioxygenase [Longimycelium tulufanense]|uniref:Phytanoyl-CoA dioxygenase n=1 Tax=Longimycelium tulufanense TaxID=907463 RepID=A0A8J3FT10_9PSEU|nr:phytanoyl-CoA dioxygenase family protein [Longimycelium tulufanense]GGM41379.1 phytanoyl-CoA dioxygenase [Longimycelium tulufanense]